MLLYIWWSWSIERIKRDVLHEMSSHLNTSQLCCIFSELWIELSFFYPQSHGKAVEEQINHHCHSSSFLLFTTWQVFLLCEKSLGSKISPSPPFQPVLFNFSLSEQCFISILWSCWRQFPEEEQCKVNIPLFQWNGLIGTEKKWFGVEEEWKAPCRSDSPSVACILWHSRLFLAASKHKKSTGGGFMLESPDKSSLGFVLKVATREKQRWRCHHCVFISILSHPSLS